MTPTAVTVTLKNKKFNENVLYMHILWASLSEHMVFAREERVTNKIMLLQ